MVTMTVELRNVEGTEAALGWAGSHTVVVDRPEGKAGGQGLGFNGGQLLAMAIGGCFCNDLRYSAHAMGVQLGKIAVSVTLEMVGEPLLASSASMAVSCDTLDGSDPTVVIERAKEISMVANSLRRGIPVQIDTPQG
ncbi:MAG: OsmC family protein [Rhizobiaceae bacterium]